MGRASRRRKTAGGRKVPASGPLGSHADLPPDVAEFLALLNEPLPGHTAQSSAGGTVWTIRDPFGNVAMEFRSGPAVSEKPSPEALGAGPACMDLMALWDDPEFNRQLNAGLVDIYGRPKHPEARDFFSEHHTAHDHDH